MFTVAGTQTDVEAEKKVQVPSAEPKPRSKSPSESSYTESSSISETFNECVSEGQWLINKSDGEVADFPIDEGKIINVNQYLRHSMSVCQRDSGSLTRVMERWLTSPLMKVR